MSLSLSLSKTHIHSVLGFFPGILPAKIQEDSKKILQNPGRFQEEKLF
jgi:hypothetical protein